MTSHSWAMLPVFALATIPVLWWRRSVLAVTGIALAVMVVHDLLFGWVTRCGAGLPLAFVLAYLGAVGPRAHAGLDRRSASRTLLTVAVLVVDATTGSEPIVLALPIVLIVFGIGRAVRHRTAMSRELEARTVELRQLRDERAALEVADDRARLSRQLDGLLQERLGQLTAAAESGKDLDPDSAQGAVRVDRDRQPRDPRRHARDRRPAPRRRRRAGAGADGRPPRRAAGPAHPGRLAADRDRRPAVAARDRRAVGVPHRRAPGQRRWPTSRTPASRSACASTTTPSRSGCNGPVDRTADVQGGRGPGQGARQVPRRLARREGEPGSGQRRRPAARAGIAARPMPRLERCGIAVGVARSSWRCRPRCTAGRRRCGATLFIAASSLAAGCALVWWRTHPPRSRRCWRSACSCVAVALGDGWFPDTARRALLAALRRARAGLVGGGRPGWSPSCAAAYLVAVLLPAPGPAGWPLLDVHRPARSPPAPCCGCARRPRTQLAVRGRGARGRARAVRRDRPAARAGPHRQRAARHRRPRDQRDGDPGGRRAAARRHRPGPGPGGLRRDLRVRPAGPPGPASGWSSCSAAPTRSAGPDLSLVDEVVTRAGPQRAATSPAASRATATASPSRSPTSPSASCRRA